MPFIDFSQEAQIDCKYLFLFMQVKGNVFQFEDIGIRVELLDNITIRTVFLLMIIFFLHGIQEKHGSFLVYNVFFNLTRSLFL